MPYFGLMVLRQRGESGSSFSLCCHLADLFVRVIFQANYADAGAKYTAANKQLS